MNNIIVNLMNEFLVAPGSRILILPVRLAEVSVLVHVPVPQCHGRGLVEIMNQELGFLRPSTGVAS